MLHKMLGVIGRHGFTMTSPWVRLIPLIRIWEQGETKDISQMKCVDVKQQLDRTL